MTRISSTVAVAGDAFARNREAYESRIADLHARRARALAGGPEKARRLHKERGQMLPRERLAAVLDPGSPFLEFGQLAGDGLYEGVPPGGSIITGVGLVSGRPCMLMIHDATVKGGTYYGITAKKHVRAQMFAWQHRLPCITMVQSGGAYLPALCDEAVIVRNQGAMFLGGPQLVYAATREEVDVETLGGGEMHSRISGVTDHLAESDGHAIAIVRGIVANLGTGPKQRWDVAPARAPRYQPREIYGIVSADTRHPTDNREVVARLIDDSDLQEFKPLYGDSLICGFARIKGFQVGILANNGVMFSESAVKGAHFIELACQRDIPLLFLADVSGFMVGQAVEREGIAKHGAKFMTAMASANVPRYTLITGGSYAAAYLAMCGRPFKPHVMMMWPSGRAALMGPEQAATTLAMVRDNIHQREGSSWSDEEKESFKQPIREQFEAFASPYNYAANLWCDMVIDPLETRDTMSLLLELAGRQPERDTRFGVFRM